MVDTRILKGFGYKINHFISNIFVIDPASKFKLIWDLFQVFFLLTTIFSVSIECFFGVNILHPFSTHADQHIFAKFLGIFIYSALFMDFFVNFNTGFYEKGRYYISSKFII